MSITRIQKRMQRLMGRSTGPGSTVTIHWKERSGGTQDAVYKTWSGGTVTEQQTDVRAFVHFVEFHTNQVRQYAEVEEGDLIIDFPGSVSLEGKTDLRFEVDGAMYRRKNVSAGLAAAWDAFLGNRRIAQPVLVSRVR